MEPNPLSEAARAMGHARSARKTAAAQINGRLGGRPRKKLADVAATAPATPEPAQSPEPLFDRPTAPAPRPRSPILIVPR